MRVLAGGLLALAVFLGGPSSAHATDAPSKSALACLVEGIEQWLDALAPEQSYEKKLRSLENSRAFWQGLAGAPNSKVVLDAEKKVLRTDVYLSAGENDLAIAEWKDVFFDVENSYAEIRKIDDELKKLGDAGGNDSPEAEETIATLRQRRSELVKKFGENYLTYAAGRTFLEKVLGNSACGPTCKQTALIVMEHTGAYDELRHSTDLVVSGSRPAWNDEHRPADAPSTADRAAKGEVQPMPKYADDDSIRAMFYREREARLASAKRENRLQKLNLIKTFLADPLFLRTATEKLKKLGIAEDTLNKWLKVWKNLDDLQTDVPEIVQISRSSADMKTKLQQVFVKATFRETLPVTLARTAEKRQFFSDLMKTAHDADAADGTDYEQRLKDAQVEAKKLGDLSMLTTYPFLQYSPALAALALVSGVTYATESDKFKQWKAKAESAIESLYQAARQRLGAAKTPAPSK